MAITMGQFVISVRKAIADEVAPADSVAEVPAYEPASDANNWPQVPGKLAPVKMEPTKTAG